MESAATLIGGMILGGILTVLGLFAIYVAIASRSWR